jgi:hypothetical protein
MAIVENVLPLDPCSASDVQLLWFDPDGTPSCSKWRRQVMKSDTQRVLATVWLYHLDKQEIVKQRAAHINQIRAILLKADAAYFLWAPHSPVPNMQAKSEFDQRLAEIRAGTGDEAAFAGAKRCAVRLAAADYPWVEEFLLP